MKLIILFLLSFVSCAYAQQAEAARAAIESVIRRDGYVSLNAPEVGFDQFAKDRPSQSEIIDRQNRVKRDWPDFLRRNTEPAESTRRQETPGRKLKSAVFWREFFGGMVSDDIMRGVDTWTAPLNEEIQKQRIQIELEPDTALRARMITRLDTAKADLAAWKANKAESRRARSALAMSLRNLISPL